MSHDEDICTRAKSVVSEPIPQILSELETLKHANETSDYKSADAAEARIRALLDEMRTKLADLAAQAQDPRLQDALNAAKDQIFRVSTDIFNLTKDRLNVTSPATRSLCGW